MYAIEKNDIETIKLLLDHGADVNIKDMFGKNALFNACNQASKEIVELLIKRGVDKNHRDKLGRHALFHVRSPELVRLLVDNGFDPNTCNYNGQTALFQNNIDLNITTELLNSGVDIFLVDNTGKSALEYSFQEGGHKCTRVMVIHVLERLYNYFSASQPETIRNDVNEFIRTGDEKYFPLNRHHLFAMKLFKEVDEGDDAERNEKEFRKYFSSDDFQEKLWADVIHLLSEDSIRIDGKSLIAARNQAKSNDDFDRLKRMVELFNRNKNIAKDFSKLTEKI